MKLTIDNSIGSTLGTTEVSMVEATVVAVVAAVVSVGAAVVSVGAAVVVVAGAAVVSVGAAVVVVVPPQPKTRTDNVRTRTRQMLSSASFLMREPPVLSITWSQ